MAGTEYWGWKTRRKNGGKWGRVHGGYIEHSSAKRAAEQAVKGTDYEYEIVADAWGGNIRQKVKNNWF